MTKGMYKPHQINPHIWHIQECLDNPGFMTLVAGERKALLFDSGYGSGDDLAQVVRELTSLPVELVLSHGHFDHVCGAWQFRYAWIHPSDRDLCLKSAGGQERARMWGINTRNRDWEADIPKGRDYLSYIEDGCCPLKELAAGQVFDLGGVTAEVVPMCGHTLGSVGLLLREERIFLAGDCANPTFFLFTEHSGTWEDHKSNLRHLLEMPFDHFLIGHRRTLFEKSKIEDFLRAAEKADPDLDPVFREGKGRADTVYQSWYGPEGDPDSCYMLYRGEQVAI